MNKKKRGNAKKSNPKSAPRRDRKALLPMRSPTPPAPTDGRQDRALFGSGGRRLGNFRAGDRSEYLALYALTRLAFVNPAPRQEEFGVIDFLCTIAEASGALVYPRESFYIQIKSNEDPIALSKDAAGWIFNHMSLPLFIGVVDKQTQRIRLFSTNDIWAHDLVGRGVPTRITFTFAGARGVTHVVDHDSVHLTVPLGPPIVDVTIDALEHDQTGVQQALAAWCAVGAFNVEARSSGAITFRKVEAYQANSVPTAHSQWYLYEKGTTHAEATLAPALTALAHCYHHRGGQLRDAAIAGDVPQRTEYERLRLALDRLSDVLGLLDAYTDGNGKSFATRATLLAPLPP